MSEPVSLGVRRSHHFAPRAEEQQGVPQAVSSRPMTCPSWPCEEGVQLLGVMTASGRLAYVNPPTAVSAGFVERVRSLGDGRPERRFRFAGPCIEGACPQWTGCGCGIADVIVAEHGAVVTASPRLPACTIRRSCRWFAQHGSTACRACPTVVADTGGTHTIADGPPSTS